MLLKIKQPLLLIQKLHLEFEKETKWKLQFEHPENHSFERKSPIAIAELL